MTGARAGIERRAAHQEVLWCTVLRRFKDLPDIAVFAYFTVAHDDHLVSDFADQRQSWVMNYRHLVTFAQGFDQVDDLLRIVTSSAVVGSSAISNFGCEAIAMAIITRCCWPPDI